MYSFSFLRNWSMQSYSATITCSRVASLTPKRLLTPKRYKFHNKIHVSAIWTRFSKKQPFIGCDIFPQIPTYLRQKFSGLSWMVKSYYIQDYPETFRGNTETRNNSLGFNQVVNREQSNQARKKRTCGAGRWLFTSC